MTDPKDMFQRVESMPAPDLWDEARSRSALPEHPDRGPRARNRLPAALVAVAAAGLSFFLLVRTFGPAGPPDDVASGGPTAALAFESGDDVFLLNAVSDNVEPLIDRDAGGAEGSLGFAWSPDATMVAFTDDANGKRRLFVAAADGTGARAISPPSLSPDDPAWSPDGSRIAFAATVDGVSDIYVADTDGNSIEQVTAVARNGVDGAFMPAWSPDGARIALIWIRYDDVDATEDQTVALVGADGGEPESLTEGPLDESPAWSASGNQIAFLSKIDSGVALKVVNPTTRTERTVTTLAPGDEFAWSPTEDSLAFVDARTGALLIEAPDGEVREVAAGSAFGGLHAFGLVSWTPDGSWVGVAARDGGDVSRIFGVPVSGGNPIPLTPAEMPAYAPMWRPA